MRSPVVRACSGRRRLSAPALRTTLQHHDRPDSGGPARDDGRPAIGRGDGGALAARRRRPRKPRATPACRSAPLRRRNSMPWKSRAVPVPIFLSAPMNGLLATPRTRIRRTRCRHGSSSTHYWAPLCSTDTSTLSDASTLNPTPAVTTSAVTLDGRGEAVLDGPADVDGDRGRSVALDHRHERLDGAQDSAGSRHRCSRTDAERLRQCARRSPGPDQTLPDQVGAADEGHDLVVGAGCASRRAGGRGEAGHEQHDQEQREPDETTHATYLERRATIDRRPGSGYRRGVTCRVSAHSPALASRRRRRCTPASQ